MIPVEVAEVLERVTPPDGWWKNDTEIAIQQVVTRLLERGFTVDETTEIVLLVVGAVREEYGD